MKKTLILICTLFIGGCIPCYEDSQPICHGTIDKEVYIDPNQYFSIDIPCFLGLQIVDDRSREGFSQVTFLDAKARIFKVEMFIMTDQFFLDICAAGLGEKAQLKILYEEEILGQYKKWDFKFNTLAEEYVQTELGLCHFSNHILFSEEANILRAFLIHLNSDSIVVFTYQPSPLFTDICGSDEMKDHIIRLSSSLKRLTIGQTN